MGTSTRRSLRGVSELHVMVATAAAVLLLVIGPARALNNGVARTPPMGWSSWDTARYNVNETFLKESAQALIDKGLAKAGYVYVLIDDGWMKCDQFNSNGGCSKPSARDGHGRIVPDPAKFPSGMPALTQAIHDMGLKIGIYTAVSARTCGGFTSSLGHEAVDAATFVEWGFDFVKHDTCNFDCGIHDGCIQKSTKAMSDGLNATGVPTVYYIDDGNDSSGMRLFNPRWFRARLSLPIKIADQLSELIWFWGPDTAHMWKIWFDIDDRWDSIMDNIHQMIGLQMYQSCGAYNHPDMLVVGGKQPSGHYRVQFFMYALFGSALILDRDVRSYSDLDLELLTSPEIIQVDQDPDCVQASLVRMQAGGETYIRPLSDGTFAGVLLNTAPTSLNITVYLGDELNGGDFYPANMTTVAVRDLYLRQDLGIFTDTFTVEVPAEDARIFSFTGISGR
jgi:alpha-galactosidase